jgi:hypothetical protein
MEPAEKQELQQNGRRAGNREHGKQKSACLHVFPVSRFRTCTDR